MINASLKRILNTSISAIVLTFLMKGLGFFREIALSHYFGASNVTDAYNISLIIPISLFEYATFAMGVSYIPIFKRISEKESKRKAFEFSNSLLLLLILYTVIIHLSLQFFTFEIVSIFASGFDEKTMKVAVVFSRIISWNIYFLVLGDICSGYLQAIGKYSFDIISSVPYNICVIFSILVASETSNVLLAYGALLASLIKAIYMVIVAISHGYTFKTDISFRSNEIKHFVILAFPTIVMVISEQVNTIIDKSLASNILVGGISILSLSSKIIDMIRQVLVRPLAIVAFPKMCLYAEKKDINEFSSTINQSVKAIILLILPVTSIILVDSENVIEWIFGHGAFDKKNVIDTASALSMYSLGLIGYSCREIFGRAFYAIHDTKTPMENSIICIVLNIVLNFVFSSFWGISGLALATALAGIVSSVFLGYKIQRYISSFISREFAKFIIIVIAVNLLMYLLISFFNTMFIFNYGWAFSILIGLGFYFYILHIFNYDIVEILLY